MVTGCGLGATACYLRPPLAWAVGRSLCSLLSVLTRGPFILLCSSGLSFFPLFSFYPLVFLCDKIFFDVSYWLSHSSCHYLPAPCHVSACFRDNLAQSGIFTGDFHGFGCFRDVLKNISYMKLQGYGLLALDICIGMIIALLKDKII